MARALAWMGLALLAFVLTLVPGGIWSALLLVNLNSSPAIPWAAAVMAAMLLALWAYLDGKGPPRRTSASRRQHLRATMLPSGQFVWAVGAGLLGIVALTGFWIVLIQLAKSPGNALPDFSRYPAWTVAVSLVIASVLGAATEEAGFRGYLQGALEVKLGPFAIPLVALVMSPAHALTQGFVWTTFVFYLAVDTMLGFSAWLTQSIVPGVIVHAVGLLTFFTLIWPHDAARPLISAHGPDAWFWLHVGQAVLFSTFAVLAFRRLAQFR